MEDFNKTVLQDLLTYFDQKKFDLDVWRIKAMVVFKKIFGDESEKLKMIEALHYDYSSWSLRDIDGTKQTDSVKELAKGILESAILELSFEEQSNFIEPLLSQHLTGAELSSLQNKLDKIDVNESEITEYFSKLAPAAKDAILAQLILKKR